jgi:hypothetical protein
MWFSVQAFTARVGLRGLPSVDWQAAVLDTVARCYESGLESPRKLGMTAIAATFILGGASRRMITRETG